MRTHSEDHWKKPDPNRDLATLSDLRAAIDALESSGITHIHELHIRDSGQGSYMFDLETPRTEKSNGRASTNSGLLIKDMDETERTKEFTDMGTRCATTIQNMNDGVY